MAVAAQPGRLCIDTLRFLSVDMVQKANSGHPGLPLGAATMACAVGHAGSVTTRTTRTGSIATAW